MRSPALALALILAPALVHATPLLGVTFSINEPPSILYDVDSSTGEAGNPRSLSDPGGGIAGIEIGADGTVYAVKTWWSGDDSNALVTIDRETGLTTAVGPTGFTSLVEGDLAFDPVSGVLYGIGGHDSVEANQLFTLDLLTGAATVVGDLDGRFDTSALSFDALGNLYATEVTFGNLLRIDPSDASVISSTPLSTLLGGVVAGMDLDPVSGDIFLADGDSRTSATFELYTLDPSTAVLTAVGPLGLTLGLSGLAVVPEPSTALLFGVGLAALSFARRRV